MAQRESLGPIQVTDNSVSAINDALRQLQERQDEAKGLSGDTTIHSGLTTDSLTTESATVNTVRVVDEDDHLVHAFGTTT